MLDALVALVLFAGVFVVHDVGYLLRAPFWVDESWVADSLKVPIARLTSVTSSSPFGWSLLLRAVPGSGLQDVRLVPLVAAGLAAAAAYVLGRELRLSRLAAFAMGVVVLFAPAMLVRDDLKQYTTEALVTLLLAIAVVRTTRRSDRRSLVALGAVCVVALPFATADLFAGSSALLALALAALGARNWRRLRDVVMVGGGVGAAWSVWLVVVLLPRQNATLTTYWDANYPPHSVHGLLHFLGHDGGAIASSSAGLHRLSVLLVAAAVALTVLAVSGDLALALMPVIAFGEMVVAGLARRFPLLDARTTTWLTVLVVALLGAGAGRALAGSWLRERVRHGRWVAGVGGLVVLLAAGSYAFAARGDVRSHLIPAEDARSQAAVVAAERRPGDIVIVDLAADWAYGYYGGTPAPLRAVPFGPVANGFLLAYPDPDTIAMTARTAAAVQIAYDQAKVLATRTPGARVWVVRMHMPAAEAAGWQRTLAAADVIRHDHDGLLLVAPAT